MSIAELWDRAWWGLMIAIFVGLVWLKFIDPYLSCVWSGVIFAALCGGVYLYVGIHRARVKKELEDED